jgi:hypothetical protein
MSVWDRVEWLWHVVSPRPSLLMLAAVAVGALFAVRSRAIWPRVEAWVTLLHEAGHAVIAVVLGQRLHGVRVHGDGSGTTHTSGGNRFTRACVSAAGYPAPAWIGAGLLAAVVAGRLGAALLVTSVIALILLPRARTWRAGTLLLLIVAAAPLYAWQRPSGPIVLAGAVAVAALAAVAILGAVRDWVGERRARTRGRTDVVALAVTTRLPAPLWWGVLGLLMLFGALPVAMAAGWHPGTV